MIRSSVGYSTRPGTSSPFFHLFPFGMIPKKVQDRYFLCPSFFYFDQNGTDMTFDESLPSSRFALFISAPPDPVTACTVWTLSYNFTIQGALLNTKDTIRIFIREANGNHNYILQDWYLARAGDNQGDLEFFEQPHAPYNAAAISPKRDIYVGLYVAPDATPGQSITWHFMTPSVYSSPPRSVRFVGNTVETASSAVGQSVDWPVVMKMCCDYATPVELSLFQASVQNDAVLLNWKTETETNNQSFEVQRALSADGPWESRGGVAGYGTSSAAQFYEFRDPITRGSPPVLYYRLRQMDFDGTIQVLPMIHVYMNPSGDQRFALLPSYPSPLVMTKHPFTTIRFQLPEADRVRVSVHDALGRDVATLLDSQQSAGFHEVQWYPNMSELDLKSGTYMVQIRSGSHSAVQKIALVK